MTSFASQNSHLSAFLHSSLIAGPGSVFPNCCIAVLHADVTEDETWALQLEHSSSTIIDVESLRTGRSAEVGGRVKVLRRLLPPVDRIEAEVIDGNSYKLGLDEQYFALCIDGIPRFYKR